MKILFAVNNDNVSEAIVKKYQKEYKEILSYKNVYYFNAILRELQKDKSYSRIVISEDLEPFSNNNYASIDKFLFEKYSSISEEAKDINNNKIDIILICADRRKKTDDMLVKVYKKEIYNAIIGQDRSIEEVCKLIYKPKDKEAAKNYYGIQESELGENESENSVSEAEVENIRAHYARLGKNEDKYLESFNNIVAQYSDTQLRIIIKYLPMNVKAVLEERSAKYQQLVINNSALNSFDAKSKTVKYKEQIKQMEDEHEDDFVQQLTKHDDISNSVVIPTNLTTKNVQKIIVPKAENSEQNRTIIESKTVTQPIETSTSINEKMEIPITELKHNEIVKNESVAIEQPKRGRGRPRKNPLPEEQIVQEPQESQEQKEVQPLQEQKITQATEQPKRGRGRPKKQPIEEIATSEIQNVDTNESKDIDLFSMEDEEQEIDLFESANQEEQEVDLFNMNEEPEEQETEVDLFNSSNDNIKDAINEPNIDNNIQEKTVNESRSTEVEHVNYISPTNNYSSNLNTLLTADKKIVAFVGTTKNGTSFVVNNTAEMLASMGIDTAILDMTKSKNAYYIYTNNEENLRNIARNCMENLQKGIAEGIRVNKKLTVYTEMPGEEKNNNIEAMLSTLLNKHSAILIDTDFETAPEIFEKVQEIYLVQTMDVLTIQPLTAFLRNLKSKDILKQEKLKIVINKSQRIKSLGIKTLIGGMSCYNSPSMTYMTELFNKDNIPYCEIPFEIQNYVKYLDALVNCSISLNGYTKQFMLSLKELANMVYPLINKQQYSPMGGKKEKRDPFSSQVNDTLNKMKSRY